MISLGSLYLVSVSFGADSRLSQEGDEGAGRFCCCTAADPSFVSKARGPCFTDALAAQLSHSMHYINTAMGSMT